MQRFQLLHNHILPFLEANYCFEYYSKVYVIVVGDEDAKKIVPFVAIAEVLLVLAS